MTALLHWISPQTMQSLGWALVHFLWQGTAIAALAAVIMATCRSASVRYCLGVGALALMLATPVATFLAQSPSGHTQSPQASDVAPRDSKSLAPAVLAFELPSSSQDAFRWLVEAWLAGVVAFSLRSAGGLLLVEREQRKGFAAVSGPLLEMFLRLQRRLGIDRSVRYCQCVRLQTPAVLGWFRPIVMLPVSALTGLSAEQLRSVIAHELAHIQRLDAFVNVFQICVETLLFYHPAVWWLNRRIRDERELCCDDIAVSICGNPLEYARALTLMEQWRNAPAFAMAATRGPLFARVSRLLGLKSAGTRIRGLGFTTSVLCLTTALIAGNTFLGVVHPRTGVRAPASAAVPAFAIHFQTAVSSAASQKPSPAQSPEKTQSAVSASSYIDALKAAGLTNLTADQLIALKVQDVTADYVHGLSEQGLALDANEIIAMRVQDVTPEYIRDLRALGVNADGSRIIGLKVQGVTPEYVRGLKDIGLDPDADRLIALKVQDVTPEYIRDLHSAGITADVDRVIAMKVQDVTPEYVRDISALGLRPTADQIISMKVQDVTPGYIKALQSAGFKVDIDGVISAKVQDITPDFIDRARKHGFQNLTLEKLIELKRLGVLDPQGEI
jgi:beta-lactamase regulating signal transducer with metallopeptidase domain